MVFRNGRFEWVWFGLQISIGSGPKFIVFSPNAEESR